MRRSTSFRALVALFVIAMTLLCNLSFAEGGNCQDKLVGSSYDCTFVNLALGGVTITSNCAEFVTGGLSQQFDWVVGELGLGVQLGCACETTGSSLRSYSYEASANAFECVGNDAGDLIQFHGKIESNQLRGQASDESGQSMVFKCRKRSMACP
jgi:hypothetical protein